MKRTSTVGSLSSSTNNNRSSSNLTKSKQGASFRQQNSTATESSLAASVEDEVPIPSLGAGWLPVSGAQQFRTLRKGPLYDARTLPVIPAPFLIDFTPPTPNDGASTTLSSLEPAGLDNSPHHLYPKYRIADPLPSTSTVTNTTTSGDDEDDEPFSAPLPQMAAKSNVLYNLFMAGRSGCG
ncbi:Hypothetical protein, putative [Bodo saltans]|uniref:Uncharacterized protein n=1 Tax=Bodo saltans TaxID=75058 RepID=A0A0S4J8C7_BODSA|nr:Hypothetical protein, putative [Bodo saltans]|eukprot:CUG86475.1 Hypothetical protein, putative [Bodo saltans]